MKVPVSTLEKPLTAIDFIAALEECSTIPMVQGFTEQVPLAVLEDARFTKALARRISAINRSAA